MATQFLPLLVYFGAQKLVQVMGNDIPYGSYLPMVAAILAFVVMNHFQKASAGKKTSAIIGHKAPDFEVTLKGGTETTLEKLIKDTGLPTVIDFYRNFWPACGPAAKDMDKLAADARYKGKVNFILVNMGSMRDVEDYIQKQGLTGAAMHGAIKNGSPAQEYGLMYIPHKVIVDKNGIVARNFDLKLPVDIDSLLEDKLDYAVVQNKKED